jgi:hypothetical protein
MCPTPRRCAQLDKWVEEVAPGAVGWLGSTSGVTDDGTLIALARFESAEAVRQNSDRPEQTAWWEQTAALFTEEPVFHNSTSVEVDTPGDPSRAGFAQVMQGRSSDPDRARELMANDPTDWQEFRPDILGTVSVGHDGDAWGLHCARSSRTPPCLARARADWTLIAAKRAFFDRTQGGQKRACTPSAGDA